MAEIKKAGSVAVVGGGWAGCAAAVELADAGCKVVLFEAARTLGGRARAVAINGKQLDNGQHIMLGAYRDTLRLMRRVGIDSKQALLKLPLQMRYPDGSGGMDFIAPRLPAPLHLLAALLRARGLGREDKMSLARFSTSARWTGWQLYHDCSVSELLERWQQTPRLIQLMWRPLCLAALNTPPERASARVFLNVLRDSLGAQRSASDMLLPRADLTALFPGAAANYVTRHGGSVRTGATVQTLKRNNGGWRIGLRAAGAEASSDTAVDKNSQQLNDMQFDGIVLACPARHAASLLTTVPDHDSAVLRAQLSAFEPEAITTCYLQYAADVRLPQPFFALIDDAESGNWGQFVFDRGQLDASQAGLLAVVISASGAAAELDQAALGAAIAAQLAAVFRRPELAAPAWIQVITEKRATYACTPALMRPANASGLPGLVLAGDYTAGDYPATLESAVRSGLAASAALLADAP